MNGYELAASFVEDGHLDYERVLDVLDLTPDQLQVLKNSDTLQAIVVAAFEGGVECGVDYACDIAEEREPACDPLRDLRNNEGRESRLWEELDRAVSGIGCWPETVMDAFRWLTQQRGKYAEALIWALALTREAGQAEGYRNAMM